jgi:hypothetical protein
MQILNSGNQQLLLDLLLYFETGINQYVTHHEVKLDQYSKKEVETHLAMLFEAELIQGHYIPEGTVSKYIYGGLNIHGKMKLRDLRKANLI